MYILDTCALQSIKRSTLELIRENVDIAISPLTFYELLCHLDETKKGKNFDRQKGNVLKCKIPRILHDPFASYTITVGAEKDTNPSRFEEPVVIEQFLEKLEKAKNLDGFFNDTIAFPDGAKGFCNDVAQRASQVLEREELRYLEILYSLKDMLKYEAKNKYSEDSYNNISPIRFESLISKFVSHLTTAHSVGDGILDKDLLSKVNSSMYLFFGYITARVIKYIKEDVSGNIGFKPDKNDCEDAFITLHLQLLREDTLVTNDGGTKKTLEWIIKTLRENQKECKVRVINSKNFISETLK
ncbi:MAG: hypothetical protein SCARUB_00512 [Candidatus Scalindua rubra]|uniref:Uncharacterized protein n=1 Tax=Candidatus Scalindua rubra TaxID=1872076 RepID=A0A1E3XFH7_9BACT|nr:MAG: hypothetical protein SCARUB_00512 [Candidatus Scalindua rubra]